MSAVTRKPKAPEHARSPTWSKPIEPVQVSNAEVAARAQEETEAQNGFFLDQSFLGFRWVQTDGNGCHFGYDAETGEVGAGLTTDVGSASARIGAGRDEFGHERGNTTGISASVKPKVGDTEFGIQTGQVTRLSDDTEVVHEGPTVLIRRTFGATTEAKGGISALVGGLMADVNAMASGERTRRISTPAWIALCAEHRDESEAARAVVGALDVAASATELGDGEHTQRSFAAGGSRTISASAGADVENTVSTDHHNELTAERHGDKITFTSTAVIGATVENSVGLGLDSLFVQTVGSHAEGSHFDTTGTLTLDLEEDAALIRQLETTMSADARLALIVQNRGPSAPPGSTPPATPGRPRPSWSMPTEHWTGAWASSRPRTGADTSQPTPHWPTTGDCSVTAFGGTRGPIVLPFGRAMTGATALTCKRWRPTRVGGPACRT